ncbi:MAG: carbohydrate-binding domain-containing protein [Clostridium sp.]|nr:carbohydrate-binding domain-containing protein [Clostridium sp.]
MAGSKITDKIALIAIVAALLVTAAFTRGEALGIRKIVPTEESSLFTDNDLDDSWDTSQATVITLTGDNAEIEGDGAYFRDGNLIIFSAGKYILRGTLTDGSVIVDETSKTTGKTWILADGVDVYCSDSAALDIEEADKVFLTLADGTENSFSSGAEYSDAAVENSIRGAVFSRDDLTVNGTGSLSVSAEYRHGIVCNDDLRIAGGTVTVTAAEDGIHANDSAVFGNMDLTVSAGDDGITCSNDEDTAYITFESGTVNITECAEGIEAKTITVNGGDISVSFTDDGFNAGGTDSLLTVNGGTITLLSADGRDVDGLDSNGDIVINGGTIFVSVTADGMNNAIDFGSESGGNCFINGGTVIAAGSSGMAEAMSGDSAQASLMYNFDENQAAGQTIVLKAADGSTVLEETIPYSFSSLVLSSPSFAAGDSFTLLVGETSYDIELTETATTYGNAGFGGMGGGMGGPGGGFGRRIDAQDSESGDREFTGPPEGFDGEMPESAQNGEFPQDGVGPRDGEFPQGGGFGGPVEEQEEDTGMSPEEVKTALAISGVSLLVLLCGIFAASRMKNRKNIA